MQIGAGAETRPYVGGGAITYENEKDKPSTPSKEELELNEKNLAIDAAAGKLGKLYFKLRFVAQSLGRGGRPCACRSLFHLLAFYEGY